MCPCPATYYETKHEIHSPNAVSMHICTVGKKEGGWTFVPKAMLNALVSLQLKK